MDLEIKNQDATPLLETDGNNVRRRRNGTATNKITTMKSTEVDAQSFMSMIRTTLIPFSIAVGVLSLSFVAVCDTSYYRKKYPQLLLDEKICAPVYDALIPDYHNNIFPHTTTHRFPLWPATTVLTFILLVVPVVVTLVPQSTTQKRSSVPRRSLMGVDGDPIIWRWALIITVIPILIIYLVQATRYSDQTSFLSLWVDRLGKASGYCAAMSLALFLVPVSRTTPLLVAVGWSPVHAVGLHIWSGYSCFATTLLHGSMFVYQKGLTALYPKGHCWNPTNIEGRVCYKQWRNFTGFVTAVAMCCLVVTSLNDVRRANYRFFYLSHVLFAPIVLIFSVLHYYFISVYVVGGFLYWLAYRIPIFVQQRASHIIDGGVACKRATFLVKSNVVELVFARRRSTMTNELKQRPTQPVHVRLCVPEFSNMVWHPFSVTHDVCDDDGGNDELKLMFRSVGPFTTALYDRLRSRPLPVMLVDGYHYGSDWVTSASQHDTVLLVAGGIGITAMLPLLEVLLREATAAMRRRTKTTTVHLHWCCRDEGLIRYVIQEYFLPMLNGFSSVTKSDVETAIRKFHITVHFTSREAEDPTPFVLYEKENGRSSSFRTKDKMVRVDSGNLVLDFAKDSSTMKGYPMRDNASDSRLVTSVRLLSFASAYIVYMFWYVTRVRASPQRILFRLDSIYVAVVILLFSAVATEIYERRCFVKDPSVAVVTESDDDDPEVNVDLMSQRRPSTKLTPAPSLSGSTAYQFFSAVATEIYERRYFIRSPSVTVVDESDLNKSDEDPEENVDLTQPRPSMERAPAPSLPFEASFSDTNGVVSSTIRMNVVNGRPFLGEVVHPVVVADSPGAFYCGPHLLNNAVQQKIASGRTKMHGICASRCSTYQEHFET